MSTFDELPHSADAERAVLSCMMLDPAQVLVAAKSSLSPEHFYKPHHRAIFEAMSGMKSIPLGGPIDVVMLSDELRNIGMLDEIGGIAMVADLMDDMPNASMVSQYQAVLERDWKRRTMFVKACERARQARYATSDDEVEGAIRAMQSDCDEMLISTSANGYVNMPPALNAMLDEIQARQAAGGGIPGISTGIAELDELTNGYQPGQQWVIGARPSVGKSAMILTLAYHLLNAGVPVGVFTAEMSTIQMLKRMTAAKARINTRALDRAEMNKQGYAKLSATVGEMMHWPLYLCDRRGITSGEITRQARQMVKREGVKVVFVDYLQKIRPSKTQERRHQEVAAVSNDLFNMAGDLGINTVLAAQIGRPAKGVKMPQPSMADLRESGDIEQDADVIALLHRLDDESNEETASVKMIVDKVRNGATGDIYFDFDKPRTFFEPSQRNRE